MPVADGEVRGMAYTRTLTIREDTRVVRAIVREYDEDGSVRDEWCRCCKGDPHDGLCTWQR